MGNSTSSDTEDESLHENVGMESDEISEGDVDNGSDGLMNLDSLFDGDALRSAATKVSDDVAEDIIQKHRELIVRWLEDIVVEKKLEFVTLSEFRDMLLNHGVEVGNILQVFQQYDIDDEGVVDARFMLDCLMQYSRGRGSNSDLESSIRILQMCPLTPGFFDIYNEDKGDIGRQASRILKFLLRNRAAGSAFPFPALTGFNNRAQLRQSALNSMITSFKKSQKPEDQKKVDSLVDSSSESSSVSSCLSAYEVSSNKSDSQRLFTNDDAYWQSDGAARSHWIRLTIKNNVFIRQLFIKVSSSDRSYMPQHVTISVGHNVCSMREIKDVRIPADFDGDYLVLENAKVFYPLVQINIKRCQSDGCDTRIHGIKIRGYRMVQSSKVSVSDSLAVWYLQVMASTVSVCLPIAPQLRISILQQSRMALENMPPFSLSQASGERPACLSQHVLNEIESFLQTLAVETNGKPSVDGLGILLSFSLARGHLASVIKTVISVKESAIDSLKVGKLLHSMKAARKSFWHKHGRLLEVTLAGCDGDKKQDGCAPDIILRNNWSSPEKVYHSGDGKTRVNMFFKASEYIQLTKVRMKVEKGARGPRCGLVFVYSLGGDFVLEDHVKLFEKYDSWRSDDYDTFRQFQDANEKSPFDPVAFFTAEDDWDEFEVVVEDCSVEQYVLVKFLEPRQSCAERLGIVGIKFIGYLRKAASIAAIQSLDSGSYKSDDAVLSQSICNETLAFFTAIIRDETRVIGKPMLTLSDMSVKLIWEAFKVFNDSVHTRTLVLHLFHAMLNQSSLSKTTDQEATDEFYSHLCNIVDQAKAGPETSEPDLVNVAKDVIVEGAAVFFPDKDSRRQQLFDLIHHITALNELPSATFKFQSLCRFYSQVDPTGLLGLPSSPTEALDIDAILTVMDTLLTVSHQECPLVVSTASTDVVATPGKSDGLSYLVRLLCSLQASLFVWCSKQKESETSELSATAQAIIVQYVQLLVPKLVSLLRNLSGNSKEQMLAAVKLYEGTSLSTTFPQLVLLLNFVCKNVCSETRMKLLSTLQDIIGYLAKMAAELPTIFHGVESDFWTALERPDEVLQVWDVESPHNYENNQNITQVFVCSGATSFRVEFDHRCETEKKYDYLEFTDIHGTKTRCDGKYDSESWQSSLTIKSGVRLHFLFHSDGSNNEWGYKFKVSALGRFDEPLCWLFDAYLSLSKLLGKMCGMNLSYRQVLSKESSNGLRDEILNSDLWTTLFRGGYIVGKLRRSLSGKHTSEKEEHAAMFLCDLVDQKGEEEKQFVTRLHEHYSNHGGLRSVGGSEIDQAVVTVFVALVWHTQSLREEMDRYAKSDHDGTISDGVHQAYAVAESIRLCLIEERQKLIVEKEVLGDSSSDYDPVAIVKEKAMFLLKFAGLSKVHLKIEKPKLEHRSMKTYNRLLSTAPGEQTLKIESVLDKFPSFRLVLEFVRDMAWSSERVAQLLKERSQQAKAATSVYIFLKEFMDIVQKDNIFQIPTVVLLQELLQNQKHVGCHYADGLDGCGLELEASLRDSFYTFLRTIIGAIQAKSRLTMQRRYVTVYDCVVACALHFLDINWQLYDLSFVEEMNLPHLYHSLCGSSVARFECTEIPQDDEKEAAAYKRTKNWMEKYQSDLMAFYRVEAMDAGKQMAQMFIAQYSYKLKVSILCDGCSSKVPGRRYRCLNCTDMDLCPSCFAGGVLPPGSEHSADHELIHLQYWCNNCQGFIIGTRFHCDECEDFDLCYGCQQLSSSLPRHKPEHSVTKHPNCKYKLIADTSCRIQAYLHQHAWLLYSSLALSVASLLYSRNQDALDCDYLQRATRIYESSIQLAVRHFMMLPKRQDESSMQKKQDHVSSRNLEERVMGLLGAMIPETSQTAFAEDVCRTLVSEEFVRSLLEIMQGATGHDEHIQYVALGLFRQILLQINGSFKIIDSVLNSYEIGEVEHPAGYNTVQFLFMFGVACFEKRTSSWADNVITLLRRLYLLPILKEVIDQYLSKCVTVAQLSEDCSHSRVFALYVIAGFPEMLHLGSLVKYTELSVEPNHGIVFEIFRHRNQALVINKKTRKSHTLNFQAFSIVEDGTTGLGVSFVPVFIETVKRIFIKLKSDEAVKVETVWMLAVVLKALLKISETFRPQTLPELLESDFVRCVVVLATYGTGFNQKWIVGDLERLAITSFSQNHSKQEMPTLLSADNKTECAPLDPLDGLNADIREAFILLHETTQVKLSLLRAYYEYAGCDVNEVAKKFRQSLEFVLDEHEKDEVLNISKQWDSDVVLPSATSAKSVISSTDIGVKFVLRSPTVDSSQAAETVEPKSENFNINIREMQCVDENPEEIYKLISSSEMDLESQRSSQRQLHSTSLLSKELTSVDVKPPEYLLKVNRAISVIYARKLLLALLATETACENSISDELAKCCTSENLPYVLDLLSRLTSRDIFKKVVQNLVQRWQPEGLASIVHTVCTFLKDISFQSVTYESPHATGDNTDDDDIDSNVMITDKVYIPGATYLSVTFDSRCCTENEEGELIMSSSEDFSADKHVFGGENNNWYNFDMPGSTLYYKYESESSCIDWGFKFTVTGGRVGRFDTGYLMLEGFLSLPSLISSIPLNDVWRSLIIVACRQTGQPRLKAIQLLLTLLHSQSRKFGSKKLAIDLGLLLPLWKLNEKLLASSTDASGIVSSILRALTELFLVTEGLVEEWNVTEEYVWSMSVSPESSIKRTVIQGLENIAVVSLGIDYDNVVTKRLKLR